MGTAKASCEITSGGVTIAAMMNASTMKYPRNSRSFWMGTMPRCASTTTTMGTSNARPNTMNSVSTKPKYCSMSGAAVMLWGAQLWMNWDIEGMTRR